MGHQWQYPLTGTYSIGEYSENQCQLLCGVTREDIHTLDLLGIEKASGILKEENDISHILLNDNVHEQQYHFFQATAELCHWYWL